MVIHPVVRAGSKDVHNNYALGSNVDVTVSGGNYFDGQDNYTVTTGAYLFQNVPSSHPMAFTMNQAGQNVVFGGHGANARTENFHYRWSNLYLLVW